MCAVMCGVSGGSGDSVTVTCFCMNCEFSKKKS
jgi:hypothetical protein